MYTDYYGFREKPFALSPDPRFLYLSASHREVLGHLVYGIEQGEGFMAITGEVGTGKTTLCRTLLRRLGSESEVAFIFNPSLSPLELLKAINAEFGLSTFGDSKPELTDVLNAFLLEKRVEGRRVLLIVDEAQNLSSETLEQLRLLSNLETETSKLLQIVLLGQPELDQKLAGHELRQLRQRISVRWHLGPLDSDETHEYVRHRLRIAGALERPIFTDAALRTVHRISGGVPRVINLLCDRALLAGYAEQQAQVGPAVLRRVATELRPTRSAWWQRPLTWVGAASLCLALAAGSLLAFGGGAEPDAAAPLPAPGPVSAMPELPEPDSEAISVPPMPAVRFRPADQAAPAEIETSVLMAPGSSGVLDALLPLRSPEEVRASTLDAALAAWRLPPSGAAALGQPELEKRLRGRQLRLIPVAAEIQALAQAAAPALVSLRDAQGVSRTALLRHLSRDYAEVEGVGPGGQGVRVATEELLQHMEAEAFVIWRNFEGLPSLIQEGDVGASVTWLQRALAELDYYRASIHGSFDAATRDAVARFQRDQGLSPDGSVGPRTQMRLYEAHPRYVTPTLASDSFGLAHAL